MFPYKIVTSSSSSSAPMLASPSPEKLRGVITRKYLKPFDPPSFANGITLLEHLSTSRYATTFKGVVRSSRTFLAVKIADFDSELPDEARITARLSALNNPHLVQYHSQGLGPTIGRVVETFFLACHFINGPSLHAVLQSGPIDLPRALEIAHQVCFGLACAKEEGILHRDLKPSHVLLEDAVRARIIDFGLSHYPKDRTAGTWRYAAPEQLKEEKIDHRVDIYAVGELIYIMLTRAVIFNADSKARADYFALKEKGLPPIPGIPASLQTLTSNLLAFKRDRRPSDYVAIMEELAEIASAV